MTELEPSLGGTLNEPRAILLIKIKTSTHHHLEALIAHLYSTYISIFADYLPHLAHSPLHSPKYPFPHAFHSVPFIQIPPPFPFPHILQPPQSPHPPQILNQRNESAVKGRG